MMVEPGTLTLGVATLGGIAVSLGALLKGWNEWLDLRREQVRRSKPLSPGGELSRLRQRVRRLEAIADGGEL
jgi:hypothetical protein